MKSILVLILAIQPLAVTWATECGSGLNASAPDAKKMTETILCLQEEVNTTNRLVNKMANELNAKFERTNGIVQSNANLTQVRGNFAVEKNRWDGEVETRRAGTSMVLCPEGSYVVGLHGVDDDGGKYCKACISKIEFECRKL